MDVARPVGQRATRELHRHVPQNVADVAPCTTSRTYRHDRIVDGHDGGARACRRCRARAGTRDRTGAPARNRTWWPTSRAGRTLGPPSPGHTPRPTPAPERPRVRPRTRQPRPGRSSTGTSRRTCWSAAWCRARASADSGVAFLNSRSHSKSWRGSPVHAQMRCRTSTCRVVSASPSLNDGRRLRDRRVPSQFSVVDEPREEQRRHRLGVRRNHEERVGVDLLRLRRARGRRSRPRETTLPFWTSPMATPGTPSWSRARSTNAERSAMRAASSGRAGLPAKVSR